VHGKFSVKYALIVAVVDEQGRRYFKKMEVQLWRLAAEAEPEPWRPGTPEGDSPEGQMLARRHTLPAKLG
jgi:hypothetical protein